MGDVMRYSVRISEAVLTMNNNSNMFIGKEEDNDDGEASPGLTFRAAEVQPNPNRTQLIENEFLTGRLYLAQAMGCALLQTGYANSWLDCPRHTSSTWMERHGRPRDRISVALGMQQQQAR